MPDAETPAELIEWLSEAAGDAMDALTGALAACCPGGAHHGFIEHGDGHQPWCPHCNYTRWGVKVR